MSTPKAPVIPGPPQAPHAFSFDDAIKRQLADAPPDARIAFVAEAEKRGDENARGQASILVRSKDGHWVGKGYVMLEEHERPSYGAKVTFST